jgi:hypothetical protein
MNSGKSPVDTLVLVSGGQCVPRALHVVADFAMADALGESPETAATLAAATGTDPATLGRVLRLLAGYGVFEVRGGSFAHTAASRLLRSDHPRSMRSFVRMLGFPIYWRVWEGWSSPCGRGLRPPSVSSPAVLGSISRNTLKSRRSSMMRASPSPGGLGVVRAQEISGTYRFGGSTFSNREPVRTTTSCRVSALRSLYQSITTYCTLPALIPLLGPFICES